MKKQFILLLFLVLIFKLHALDVSSLEPLKNGETLKINYQKNILNIERISKNKSELYFSCKSSWGAWQISEDKTKVLIYEDNMHEIYLLDGNDGAISYKGKIKHTAFPNSTFNYLITTKLVPEEEMINFEVFDLNTMKEIYSFSWMSQKENFLKNGWLTFSYYRSLDKKYDYVIYSLDESGYAYGYFLVNVSTKEMEEHIFEFPQKIPKKSNYENGWE